MKRTLFCICTVLAASACQRSSDRDSASREGNTTSSTSTTNPANPSTTTLANRPAENPPAINAPASASDKPADNTGKNERDRDNATLTSGDQGSSEADRKVSQQIRKAVVDDASLSTTAKNIKIITNEGVVTLRGPVKTSSEKVQIAAIAQRTGGVKRVDNQLEIANK